MRQKQIVILITKKVLGDNFKPNLPILSYISNSEHKKIIKLVYSELSNNNNKQIDKKLHQYTIKMINNWFKKAKELNGGASYAKAIGTKSHPSDPVIRHLYEMRNTFLDQGKEDFAKDIEQQIQTRIDELKNNSSKETL